MYVDQENMQK